MEKAQKIALLNTLHEKVVHYVCADNVCGEVLIELDKEAQHVLNKLGIDDQYIEINKIECNDGTFVIDISHIGFDHCGAKYWHSKLGFLENSYENPDAVEI